MRAEISMSNRNLSIDTDIAVLRRDMSKARKAAAIDVLYGIEVLKPKGWTPLSGLFLKRRTYSSLDDAIEACAAYWRRSGLAARPYPL